MPKAKQGKRNSVSKGNPYSDAAAKTKAANSVFKMNTDIGQHVLKNPGIAQAIVDKAELKQSDVSVVGGGSGGAQMRGFEGHGADGFALDRSCLKLVLVQVT